MFLDSYQIRIRTIRILIKIAGNPFIKIIIKIFYISFVCKSINKGICSDYKYIKIIRLNAFQISTGSFLIKIVWETLDLLQNLKKEYLAFYFKFIEWPVLTNLKN